MTKFPMKALSKEDEFELRFMMGREYSLHNLDPHCNFCIQCESCYLPNKVKSQVLQGRIRHFMREIETLPQEDGSHVFQCKLIFDNKIHQLKDNRDYALQRAQKAENQLQKMWASSLKELNQTMNLGLQKGWWKVLSPVEEAESGRQFLPLSFIGKRG